MIFHENRLLADDSHVISYLIIYFTLLLSKIGKDVSKFVIYCTCALVIGALRVKELRHIPRLLTERDHC